MKNLAKPRFRGRDVLIACLYPFCYGSLEQSRIEFADRGGIVRDPDVYTNLYFSYRRKTFSPELEWRDNITYRSVDVTITSITCRGKVYQCRQSHVFLTIYPLLICTLQAHVVLGDEIAATEEITYLLKYLREKNYDNTGGDNYCIRCQIRGHHTEYASIENLFAWIEDTIRAEQNLARKSEHSVAFIYPLISVGHLKGYQRASDIERHLSREISGILNLWTVDSDLQTKEEVKRRLARNFHPLQYGLTFASAAGMISMHPDLIVEIAEREEEERKLPGTPASAVTPDPLGRSALDQHHDQELCYAAVLCEIAVAQYFALRVCDELIDQSYAAAKPGIRFPPFALPWALNTLRFEQRITTALGSIRHVALTRKSYGRELIEFLQTEFNSKALQDRVGQKLAGLNRIVVTTFQSTTATAAFLIGLLSIILSLNQVFGFLPVRKNAPPQGQTTQRGQITPQGHTTSPTTPGAP